MNVDNPTIIITLEGDNFYAIYDHGEGANPRYQLGDREGIDGDRWGNDRAALIRECIRRIDKRVAELRAEEAG